MKQENTTSIYLWVKGENQVILWLMTLLREKYLLSNILIYYEGHSMIVVIVIAFEMYL